jgi:hypothetical protein
MAIEWGFLILLAVGAAVAELSVPLIVLVMAIGWILVVLVELVAWRARPGYVVTETVEETPAEFLETPPESPAGAEMPPLQPPVPPPSYDFEFTRPETASTTEDTAGPAEPASAAEEADRPAPDPDDPDAPAPERELTGEADRRVVHMLEPQKPRRRRRWFRKDES